MSNPIKIPLSLAEKGRLRRWWANVSPRLRRSEYAVLVELLDRQNPKTGLCCPSQKRLKEDTGFALRTIKEAIKCLVERGVIEKKRVPGRSTLHYSFKPIPGTIEPAQGTSTNADGRSCNAPEGAARNTFVVHDDAPIKKKKENKRKSNVSSQRETTESLQHSSMTAMGAKREGEVENELRRKMEEQGINYEVLVSAPEELLLYGIKDVATGQRTMNELVNLLVEYFQSDKV